MWSRPPAADATIPVILLHPIFRQFVDDCDNHQPIQSDNELVRELMAAMSDFFLNEDARAAQLRDILTRHSIPVVPSTITSKGHCFRTDGAVAINGHLVAIVEVKEEIGSKGAEPYAQVVLYYTYAYLAKAKGSSKFNFPALLITVFGQTLLFFHAIILTECSQDRKLAFLALYGQLDPISKFLLRPYPCFVITPTRICVNLLLVISVP